MKQTSTTSFEQVWEFEEGETFQRHLVLRAYQLAVDNPNVWNFYAILPPSLPLEDEAVLRENGFRIAGNLSRDGKTLLKWHRGIRTSGEAGAR